MSSKRRHTSKNAQHLSSLAQQDEQVFEEDVSEHDPSPEPKPIARQANFDTDRIGDILKRVREHRGEELEYISDYLRIRPNYLFALESSRYEDLPADAYVIGFLRTYASYLGLDGKGAIDQYRREMTGRRRKPQLSMPQPMSEGRAPTVAMLIAAAVAALLIYGIWYGLSSPDKAATEQPIPLPETTTQGLPSNDQEAKPQPANAALPLLTATSDGIALTVPEAAVPTTVVGATATPPAGDGTQAEQKKDTTTKDAPEKKQDHPPEQQPTTAASPQPATTVTPPPTTAQPETPAAFGEKTKSRMLIKAEKESWVLVTDDKGNTIFDRTLKAGETYYVPSGKGLKLTTGNANALAFTYDGKELPKLKASTPVVRAMPLDADKMKNRKKEDLTGSADEAEIE